MTRKENESQKESADFPQFERPPVIEVVCGVRFEPIEDLTAGHYGLFWSKVKRDFPQCEHVAPLGTKIGEVFDQLPLPRVWFVSEGGESLIQLQRDWFLFNWRRTTGDDRYPTYPEVKKSFHEYLKLFLEFCKKQGLGKMKPLECELTYINHIPCGDGWTSPSSIRKVLPDFTFRSSRKRFLPQPDHVNWAVSFQIPENRGVLRVNMQQAKRKIDEVPILVLQLTAKGIGSDTSFEGISHWLDLAHEWIVKGFVDLTEAKVQQDVWQRSR